MPTYDYECSTCEYAEEIFLSISSKPLTICPQCGADTFRVVFLEAPRCVVREVKTVGQLGERNWSNKGSYERSEILAKNAEADKKVEAMKEAKKIGSMTDEQKQKYIQTGEK